MSEVNLKYAIELWDIKNFILNILLVIWRSSQHLIKHIFHHDHVIFTCVSPLFTLISRNFVLLSCYRCWKKFSFESSLGFCNSIIISFPFLFQTVHFTQYIHDTIFYNSLSVGFMKLSSFPKLIKVKNSLLHFVYIVLSIYQWGALLCVDRYHEGKLWVLSWTVLRLKLV